MGISFVARFLQSVGRRPPGIFCSLLLIPVTLGFVRRQIAAFRDAQTAPHGSFCRSEMESERMTFIKLTSAPVQATNYTDRSVEIGHIYLVSTSMRLPPST
jgi:hypothetical protein